MLNNWFHCDIFIHLYNVIDHFYSPLHHVIIPCLPTIPVYPPSSSHLVLFPHSCIFVCMSVIFKNPHKSMGVGLFTEV